MLGQEAYFAAEAAVLTLNESYCWLIVIDLHSVLRQTKHWKATSSIPFHHLQRIAYWLLMQYSGWFYC